VSSWSGGSGPTRGRGRRGSGGPTVPIVFSETRKLAEEWTDRYLAAAAAWAADDEALTGRLRDQVAAEARRAPAAEVRAWARSVGMAVGDRGRLPAEVVQAWHEAHGTAQVRGVTADETRAEGARTPAGG
jgi:hypothetical protein